MNINIKGTNIEFTDAISSYAHKKIESFAKFLESGSHVYMEVGKTTNHHKNGDIYKAEIEIKNKGEKFFAMIETDDLYKAIDMVKDEMIHELTQNKKRNSTMFRRGARSVKKMLKGLSKRNPFTSKY